MCVCFVVHANPNSGSPSLPPVLLSRFIINLRQVDSPGTNPSVNQRSSRFSIPNFHMPNMDDVVGNLGQPLDFAEYRMDDEGDAQNDGDDATAEPQHAAGLHTFWETDFTEVMRSPRAGRDNTANVDVLGTDVELEVCFISGRARRAASSLTRTISAFVRLGSLGLSRTRCVAGSVGIRSSSALSCSCEHYVAVRAKPMSFGGQDPCGIQLECCSPSLFMLVLCSWIPISALACRLPSILSFRSSSRSYALTSCAGIESFLIFTSCSKRSRFAS